MGKLCNASSLSTASNIVPQSVSFAPGSRRARLWDIHTRLVNHGPQPAGCHLNADDVKECPHVVAVTIVNGQEVFSAQLPKQLTPREFCELDSQFLSDRNLSRVQHKGRTRIKR